MNKNMFFAFIIVILAIDSAFWLELDIKMTQQDHKDNIMAKDRKIL